MDSDNYGASEMLVDCAEAQRILGMRKTFVYDLAAQGRLPAYRFGRMVRFKRSDLVVFRESHRLGGGVAPDTGRSRDGGDHGTR
jgi:excisionase family DNA binding protein